MSVKELSPATSHAPHEVVDGAHDTVNLTAVENQQFSEIADKCIDTQDAHEVETLRYRMGEKLGYLAAKGFYGAMSKFESIRDRGSATSLKAASHGTIAVLSAGEKAAEGADRLAQRFEASEDDTPTKRRMKKVGRKALVAAGGVLALVGAGAAYKASGHSLLPESIVDRIDLTNRVAGLHNINVPGTGFSLPENIYNGDETIVGYHASAGPLVAGPSYETSVAHGVDRLFDALDNTGNGVKTVEGYSQGADVIREAVSQLSEDEQRQLILNISGDPSGETGVLTLAHDSWQGRLMGALGFDTSELKSTGAATVNEIRVTNDIMADATFTIADSKKFNAAVDSGDYLTVVRMLAGTVEKAGGYATNHAGMVDVLPEHRVFHDPVNPGNATVVTEQRPNGVLHKITPNVTALEQVGAAHGFHLTPEAKEAYEAMINPEVSHEQVVRELGDAAREGIDNTPWIDPNHKPIINSLITGVAENFSAYQPPAPAPAPVEPFVAPAPAPAPAEVFVAPAPAPAPVSEFVPPVEVQQFVDHHVAPAVEQFAPAVDQIANDLQNIAPQYENEINHLRGFFQ